MSASVLLVAGARPNFVKVAPVLGALEARGVSCGLVHTGQHYDSAMSDVFFDDLGIRAPDYSLEVGSGSHATQTAAIMERFESVVIAERPAAVVVFGDVNSTVACALVAAKLGVRVVHIEAGLRSRDWTMPEEVNRAITDRISDLLLAPSADGVDNLLAEGTNPHRIRLVGNVMVDSLLASVERALARPRLTALDGLSTYALVTLHRPSNVDDSLVLDRIVAAVSEISHFLPVVWPVHPRTRQMLAQRLVPPTVKMCESLGYLDFIALEGGATIVLTDSGGVQEETTVLGIPCLTLRENTERPITISEGTNRLVGTDPPVIVDAARTVLNDPPAPRRPPLWDGRAGERCAVAIGELLGSPDWPRPTDRS